MATNDHQLTRWLCLVAALQCLGVATDIRGAESRAGREATAGTIRDASTLRVAAAAADAEPADVADREAEAKPVKWGGYTQGEFAYTYGKPDHWSKIRARLELQAEGRFSEELKWKLSGGAAYDAVFDVTNFYPSDVAHNQRTEFIAREVFLDYSKGDFDIRVGRQNIIWGEVVGFFVSDVVSAKDQREFILPDFDLIRIPQWAARAEYFKNDFHAEAILIPVMSYDNIGKPGTDFYPYPPAPSPGFAQRIENEVRPGNSPANWAYGGRASYLKDGWDGALYYYRSTSASPTFYREIVATPVPTYVYQPRHDRIWQAGATLAKDFSDFVFKIESVYTAHLGYSVTRPTDEDGVVKQNTLDYILSVDLPSANQTRWNLQFFQRIFFGHDPDIIPRRVNNGASLFVSTPISPKVTFEMLLASSLDQSDWMVRPKLVWNLGGNWLVSGGVDALGGSATGAFGRFHDSSRVWANARYTF